jgi:hypothetical protein
MSNVTIGGTLFIRSKDVPLLRTPNPRELGARNNYVPLGTKVVWLGAAQEDKAFHKIQYNGQIGFVLAANLSTQPPNFELNMRGCIKCDGSGKVSIGWGASVGFAVCDLCNGTGGRNREMWQQAYASHGAGTKG